MNPLPELPPSTEAAKKTIVAQVEQISKGEKGLQAALHQGISHLLSIVSLALPKKCPTETRCANTPPHHQSQDRGAQGYVFVTPTLAHASQILTSHLF